MVAGIRFTAQKPAVLVRSRPALDADTVSQIEEGDEIVAADVFIEEGIEWVKLPKGAKATRVNGVRKQIFLNLREDAYVPTQDPQEGLLLRKHAEVVVQEKKEEGALTKAEIQEILDKCSDPGILLPLESKYWSKQQLEMFVMSGGTIRPKWCSVPDERLMANINMSKDEIMHALSQAADWISNADAILIGSGAGMGVDSGLGTFRGGQKGVWAGLEAVGLAYEEICMPKWFKEEPHLGWAFWNFCHSAYQATVPHEGYTHAREWGQRCPLGFFSFTSNIDSHWITSGTSSERVLEVHGAVRWLQCSKPCSPDVWKAPKDLGLVEDEVTHRVRGILPTCPKCKAVARPNVQMFGGDTGFSKARRASQFSKYDAWLKKLEARPDKDEIRITCVEVGCGLTVPTVRKELEAVVRKFPGARLVRVNPENPGLSQEIADRGVSLPLKAGAAIQEIGKQVATDEDKVTFILWGEEGGVEFQAPYGTCLGRLLRMAESEDGVEVEFSKETKAYTRNPMWGSMGDTVKLDRPVPVSGFSELKAAEGPTMQATAMLFVAAKFKNPNHPHNLNPLLAKRVEQVSMLLDDMNALFKEETYQEEVKKCTDRRGVMKMAKSVHFQVLPKYGIEASDKGTAFMASWIGSGQNVWDVQGKVDLSMELSYVKQMSHLPAVDAPKKKKQQEEAPKQEPKQEEAMEPEPDVSAPLQPLEVTVSSMPTDDKEAKPDTLLLSLTNQTPVSELRQKLKEALEWDDEGTKATKFMTKISATSYGGLKDWDVVRKVVFVHGGPGLRPPEPTEVTFTEMAPDDGFKAQTFALSVMTDDTVSALRQKLGEALGWDERTQKRAKFLIRLNSGSFGTLKEHEKVAQRKTIFVHSASLAPGGGARAETPSQEVPAPKEAAPKPAAAPRQSVEQKPKPEVRPRSGEPLTVKLTVLGTQDDPEPDSMSVTLRPEASIAELRKKVAEELKLSLSGAAALKFISKGASNFSTMLNSDKVKEQVFVRGVPTLQTNPKREAAPFDEKPAPEPTPQPAGRRQAPQHHAQHQPSQARDFKTSNPVLEQIDISILVDRAMNWRIPMRIKKDTTVWQVKELIAKGDPTGKSKPEGFCLRVSPTSVLDDQAVIGKSCALEICLPEEAGRQPGQQAQQQRRTVSPEPKGEPLTVSLTRMTTLEDPKPQRFDAPCTTVTKIFDLRSHVAKVCGLDERAARRVKLLFRVPGGNGFMTAKEDEAVLKEMYVHNIDRWPE